jgi:hypothetical protein
MKDSLLKAFFVYAYSFVVVFMFNSLLMVLFMKLGLAPSIGTVLSYVITPVALFFAYKISVKKFLGVPVDEKQIFKAWFFQFIPFFIISFILFWFLSGLIKQPSLGVFVFLNLELLVIYVTFKLSVEKVLKPER